MAASSFPIIPLLLPFPSVDNDEDQYPISPKITTSTTHISAAHDGEEVENDDDEEDTLSLCDLPLHNSYNDINHIAAAASPDIDNDDDEDGFEFSREYSFTADHLLGLDPTAKDNNNNNNGNSTIVFCGKLIAHRQLAAVQQQQQDGVVSVSNEKKRKQEEQGNKKKKQSGSGRIFPWNMKSFSTSSSSSSSNSSSNSSCSSPVKKKKSGGGIAGRSSSRGYLCLAFGMEWKFPVRSMDLKDIKRRQSRRSSISLDFDVSTSSASSSMLPDDNSTAVGAKSGKGLWCLIRVLAGARP